MEEIREAMETTVTPEAPAEWWEGTSFEDAKAIIRSNMDNVARNSVAIGYYLRSIRDREQYREGGYQSFDAFVQSEYSMSYSAASRLIGLCERFSKGGNSPVLADTYQGYSKSLLVEMLPMSDAQLDQMRPGMTVAEVREIKRENREEAMPEPDPEPPAEEPEVVFQLAGEAEDVSRQEVVELNDFEKTQCAKVLEKLAEEREKHRWIPVEERLPESKSYILLSFANFDLPLVGRYEQDEDGGAFYIGDEDITCVSQGVFVNAWLPLPEPYRPEKESDENGT